MEQTERDLKRIFPEKSWIKLHKQIIFFGRKHCPARAHDPARCPICSFAATRRARTSSKRSPPKKVASKEIARAGRRFG